MRASQETEVVHVGSGWYEVRVGGEVVEDGIRGEESAQEIAEELDG
jgi:hypothetical protein